MCIAPPSSHAILLFADGHLHMSIPHFLCWIWEVGKTGCSSFARAWGSLELTSPGYWPISLSAYLRELQAEACSFPLSLSQWAENQPGHPEIHTEPQGSSSAPTVGETAEGSAGGLPVGMSTLTEAGLG